MRYSTECIDYVKAAYPESPEMHRMAKEHRLDLGIHLDIGRIGKLDPIQVLGANSLKDVRDMARKSIMREYLFELWCERYQEESACAKTG